MVDSKYLIPSYSASALAGFIYSIETLSGEQVVSSALASSPLAETIFALLIFLGSAGTVVGAIDWAGDKL